MKKFLCICLLLAVCLSSASCFFIPSLLHRSEEIVKEAENKVRADSDEDKEVDKTEDSSRSTSKESIDNPEGEIAFEKDFGTFCIPEGWEESESDSSLDKFFYIPEGNDNKSCTDYFFVRYATNNYSEDDVMSFKDAIMKQITKQIEDIPEVTLNGEGAYTANDYLLLSFTISGFEDGSVRDLYYIVGEKKYCEVYMSAKEDIEGTRVAAKTIVDSFVWTDEG
jgi:hypothetical protein